MARVPASHATVASSWPADHQRAGRARDPQLLGPDPLASADNPGRQTVDQLRALTDVPLLHGHIDPAEDLREWSPRPGPVVDYLHVEAVAALVEEEREVTRRELPRLRISTSRPEPTDAVRPPFQLPSGARPIVPSWCRGAAVKPTCSPMFPLIRAGQAAPPNPAHRWRPLNSPHGPEHSRAVRFSTPEARGPCAPGGLRDVVRGRTPSK